VRQGWGAKHKRSDTKVREEVFPDLFAFGARPEELVDPSEEDKELLEQPEEQLRGKMFNDAKRVLNGPYRVALAHAGKVDAGKPLTGASYEDYQKVAAKVAVVRYMANVTLENVRATFDAEIERPGAAEAQGRNSGEAEGQARLTPSSEAAPASQGSIATTRSTGC